MSGTPCRRASVDDAPHFAALHACCFESPWDEAGFRGLLGRSGALGLIAVDEPNARPVAFALFERVVEEAEILTFGVRPKDRRRGLAARLLAEGLVSLAECGVRRVHLEVAADNNAALALYRKSGFIESGKRAGYYRRGPHNPPVDGLVLTCRLPPASGR